jgi:hypothetical protein
MVFLLDNDSREQLKWPVLLIWGGVFYYLDSRLTHRFVSLRQPDPSRSLNPDDDLFLHEEYRGYEPTEDEVAEAKVALGIPSEPVGTPWICGACGEKNTAAFRLCWNCGSEYVDSGE